MTDPNLTAAAETAPRDTPPAIGTPTAADAADASLAMVELLTFRSGGRGYAVDIIDVREIRSWSDPTPLPHSAPYMLGMVNLRGSVLPVLDLSQRLGGPATAVDPRNVIIVIENHDQVHGLLVEAVSDIVHPAPDQLQAVPATAPTDAQDMARALYVVDDLMVQVLNIDRVLPRPTRSKEADAE